MTSTYAPEIANPYKGGAVAEGLSHLITQFQNDPNFAIYLGTFLARLQDLNDAAGEVINNRSIVSGYGVILDTIGAIIGRPRAGLSDSDYAIFALPTQIAINLASGVPEDFLTILRLGTPAGTVFTYGESYPACVVCTVIGPVTTGVTTLGQNLAQVLPAGVRLILVWEPQPDADTLYWTAYGAPTVTASQEWAYNGTGGQWAAAFEV